MSFFRFVEADEPGITPVADEDDVEANLRSIRDARGQADYVLVHLHDHEVDPDKGVETPAKFVPPFARVCIDAGADVFIGQGSHAPLRGIEVYKNRPIFYDPGDFIAMANTVTRLPSDFYWRPGYNPEVRRWDATTADAFDAKNQGKGSVSGDRKGADAIIGVCSFQGKGGLTEFKFYPVSLVWTTRSRTGLPLLAEAEAAKKITERIAQLSAPFGTKIEFKDGIGVVKV
jgi:poly-gamma-glutamate synthesis protein (capsule biosynthesis protein)